MAYRTGVAALLATALLANTAGAQTGQAVNPSPMPPGSRAGDAPGMGSIGAQSEGGVAGQPAPRNPDAGTPGGTGAMAPSAQPDVARGTAPAPATGSAATATARPAMTEEQARTQFAGAGYTDVRDLQRNPDGGWRGRAMRDGQQISVMLDPSGQVTAVR
jgi:hypothetical protein